MARIKNEQELTGSIIEQYLKYDPLTGQFVWNKMPNGRVSSGSVAGTNNQGYVYISIFRRKFSGHRLAWAYMMGEWPKGELDHINGNRSDNRIVNLRESTQSQNQSNRGPNKNNTSGFKGVKFHRKTKKWEANLTKNRVRHFIGLFHTPAEAYEAYCKKAEQLFGQFAWRQKC